MATKLESLETPALILDRAKLEANCARMHKHLERFQVNLRPHMKTAKSADIARLVRSGLPGPITVSTLKEAEFFFASGFTDILYAVGLVPSKFPRVLSLARGGCRLQVIVDTVDMALAFREFCRKHDREIPVLIEVDTDGHRAGIHPDSEALLSTASVLASAGLLGGVMTHAGASYTSSSTDEIREWARLERSGIARAAHRLREAGFPSPVVSLGSTPTALFGETFEGITEVRAGVYMFFDLVMARLGVCRVDEIALSVLATVIGHRSDKGWLITDAGWMALSCEHSSGKEGYGLVCDAAGRPVGELIVFEANQEHGLVAARSGEPLNFREFPVGTLIRVLPNHACATASQHAAYNILDGNSGIEARWERLNGW